jgi:hypothetical protein
MSSLPTAEKEEASVGGARGVAFGHFVDAFSIRTDRSPIAKVGWAGFVPTKK